MVRQRWPQPVALGPQLGKVGRRSARATSRADGARLYFSIGARTVLPHSVQEPS